MKNTLLLILLAGMLGGCTRTQEEGTLEHLNTHPNGLEVYKYYYEDGNYVFVSKFKGSNVNTVTWNERHNKHTYTYGNVIYENDSIVITRK
jgi:hypothetical protein